MLSEQDLKEKLAAYSLVTSCGCHVWLRGESGNGYGTISIGGQKQEYAHRVAYEVNFGHIPAGLVVMHSCDIPACVNPEHLSVGTQTENMQDCGRKGRSSNGGTRGTSNGRAKFNNKTALAAYLDTRSLHEIASDYGVTWQAVKLLKGGKTWQHVTSNAQADGLSTLATPTAQA